MRPSRIMNIHPGNYIHLKTRGCYKVLEGGMYCEGRRFLGEMLNFPFKKQKETRYSFRKVFPLNKIKEIVKK